jgi:F-type H+-transporting ATPase subunit delta
MKDLQTIARPYAKALFELALGHQALQAWSEVLSLLTDVVKDKQMNQLLDHPEMTQEMLVDILFDVVKQQMQKHAELDSIKQALMVMAKSRRLPLIPEICRQYNDYCAEYTKSCSAVVYTSIRLSEEQLKKLETGLQKRLQKTVQLTQVEDPSLLGGARIQIGDMVIDGSLRGRVQRLYQALSA